MASEALRPHVVNFLDMMLKERSATMRVEEIDIPEGGAWVGLSMIDIDLRGRYHLLPLAVKVPVERHEKHHHHEMQFVFNPPDMHQLTAHSVVVVMGDVQEVKRAKIDAHHKRISALTTSST
jgi:voltage-gated potassium channel